MAKTKASKSKSAEPKKKDSAPKISEDKVAKPLKPSKTAFKKAKIAEKLAKKEKQQAQDDDIPDLLKEFLNTAGESTSATATSTDDNEVAKAAAPITTTAQKRAAESSDCEPFSSSPDSESDSDSDSSSSSEEEKPAAKKPKTGEVKSATTTNTTSDLFYVDVAPSEASVNRKARQRLELIAKMKENFQKAWNVSVGSTEPHEGVDKALEEWIEKYDRTQAKVEWDLRFKKRMRAAKQIRNIEERKAAIHSLAQEKRNPNSGIGFRLTPEKTNAERKAEKKKRKAKKVKKPKANYGSRT